MTLGTARSPNHQAWLCAAVIAAAAGTASAAPIVFSVGGDTTAASIQPIVDAFRTALGTPNNGNTPGPLAGGRREINWDGGGSNATTAPVTPFSVFVNTRGARFTTPGTGLTQAPPSGGPQDGLVGLLGNPTYGGIFSTFSLPRLFAPIDSNITDAVFFVPGSNGTIAAVVGGFGAVFTDVDLVNTTQIEYFDPAGHSLFQGFVPQGTVGNGSLSFFGVLFNAAEQVARVRITAGSAALGPDDAPGNGIDVVALDDFVYREPVRVPIPSTLVLLGLGVGLAGLVLHTRNRR